MAAPGTPWFPFYCQTIGHPKIEHLSKMIKRPMVTTVGHLAFLWSRATVYRPDGDLSGLTDDEVEAWAGWRGGKGALVRGLTAAKLLDDRRCTGGVPPVDRRSTGGKAAVGKPRYLAIHNAERYHGSYKRAKTQKNYRERQKTETPELGNSDITRDNFSGGSDRIGEDKTRKDNDNTNSKKSAIVQAVVDHYRQVNPTRGRHLKPKHKDWRLILQRVNDGFSVDDLKLAIDGNQIDKWHVDNRQHSVEYIFRNATKVEGFIETARNGNPKPKDDWDEDFDLEADDQF